MNHLTIETLNLFLDQALDTPTRAAVESHLATCQVCQAELDALRDLFATLAALSPAPLPADLAAPVLQQIASMPAPIQRQARPAARPYAIAALAAQVVLAGLLLAWPGSALRGVATTTLAALPQPAPPDPSALFSWLGEWLSTFGAIVSSLAPAEDALRTSPFAGLSPAQWAIVLVVVGLVWLLGNRWIIAGSSEPNNTKQEAA
jgi:hypothetical protein